MEISVPKNYDGTTFGIAEEEVSTRAHENKSFQNEIDEKMESEPVSYEIKKSKSDKDVFSFLHNFSLKKLPFLSSKEMLPSFIRDFGTEELLIIGVALFLIFSQAHDIESALILLVLIFIK